MIMKSNIPKRFFSILLALVLVVSMLPSVAFTALAATAEAEWGYGNTVVGTGTLADALSAAKSSSSVTYIKLLSDVTVTETQYWGPATTEQFTLDLNQKTMTMNFVGNGFALEYGGDIKITGNGTVQSTTREYTEGIGYYLFYALSSSGSLLIENGTYTTVAENMGIINSPWDSFPVTINGGTFKTSKGYVITNTSQLTINGGTFTTTSTEDPLLEVRGPVTINGGSFSGGSSTMKYHAGHVTFNTAPTGFVVYNMGNDFLATKNFTLPGTFHFVDGENNEVTILQDGYQYTLTGKYKVTGYTGRNEIDGFNGNVTANPVEAEPGDNIKLTVAPGANYVLDSIKVEAKTGVSVTLSSSGNTYTFTMPASDVTVVPTFRSTIVHVTGVTLNKNELSLVKGNSETLTATVAPSNANYPTVTWTSNDGSVATVDSTTGKVTAVGAGDAIITATADGKSATCSVHVHEWSYTAEDNVITESCLGNCGHAETATLTSDKEEYTYTGSAIQPVTVTYSDGWVGDKPTTVTYENNTNVNANASGSLTIGNATATKTFAITEANINSATVNLNPESGSYTGSQYSPSVTVTFGGNTLAENTDYTVSWDDNSFTAAKAYTVTITGTGNFEGTASKTFTINAVNLSDVKVEQTGELTYTGSSQTPDVTKSATAKNDQPVTFTYSTDGSNYGDMPSFTNAGTYTVYYKASAPNHNDSTGSFTVTIAKQPVTAPTIDSKPFNGSVQTAYVPSSTLYTVKTNDGGTNKGSYDVVLELTDTVNYKWENTEEATVTLEFKITQATNNWSVVAGIQGWTYGDSPKNHVRTPDFGEAVRTYTGTANDGTSWNSTDVPEKAGNYTVTFTVEETENYTGLTHTKDFAISKDEYDMSNAKWDYTQPFAYDGKEHKVEVVGLPTGVTVSGYTGNTATKVGEYTAAVTFTYDSYNYEAPVLDALPWAIRNNWTPEANKEYTVSTPNSNGWLNTDFIVTAEEGYELAYSNATDNVWSESLPVVNEGTGSVDFCVRNKETGAISLTVKESYQLDKTNPTGKVFFDERNGWETFVNTVSFGLFYKNEVTVKTEAADALSGVASIEYVASDKAMTLDEVKAITDWTVMPEGGVVATVEDAKQFVYYVRIIDKADNVIYLSTDGTEYDTTAPAISGIENGGTYYTTQKVTVTDKNLDTVTLNDVPVTGTITLEGNKEANYTIVATDKAGNSTTVTVTTKLTESVGDPLDGITQDNVTSDDKETIEDVIDKVDDLLDDEDLTEEEKATLEEIKDEAEKLIDKIEEAADATHTENTDKVDDITPDNVKPEDKTDLEKAKEDLEDALENHGGNYTEDEKKDIQDEIDRIDEALDVIDRVEKVEEQIQKLPDNITKDDSDDVNAAKKAYDELSDYEKTLIDSDLKKKLDDAVKAAEAANKPADPTAPETGGSNSPATGGSTSPDTGDATNLWLLAALLFVSGGAVIALVYVRKRSTVG